MKSSKNILLLVGAILLACALVLVIVFRSGTKDSPYQNLLAFEELPYEAMHLRGEERIAGQDIYDAGMALYLKNDFSGAVALLKKAVAQQPDSTSWWMYLGISGYMSEQTADAVAVLEKANQMASPELKPHTRWYLALARLMAGERDPAEELLEKLIREKKDHAAEARVLLQKIRKVNPSSEEGKAVVTYPNGGERFVMGQTIAVYWDFEAEDNIRYRVMLSSDGGNTFETILINGLEPYASEWYWKSEKTHGDKLRLRVDAMLADSIILGVPSEIFSLGVVPWIVFATPLPGKAQRAGIEYWVEWRTVGSTPFEYSLAVEQLNGIEYSEIESIESGVPAEQSGLYWKNKLDEGVGYRFRLDAEYTDTTISAYSEPAFAVRAPVEMKVNCSSPLEGSIWKEGDEIAVNWEVAGESPHGYTIELCDSLGQLQKVLAANVSNTHTDWHWNCHGANGLYYLRVTAHYDEGDLIQYASNVFTIEGTTAEDNNSSVPSDITLEQNYPNPFNSSTTIQFALTQSGLTRLKVYNIMGQMVKLLVDELLNAGTHTAQFDAGGLASGTYVYRIEQNGLSKEKKMILVR